MESGRNGSDGNASAKRYSSRMLKKAASFVLVREQSSMYLTMGKEPVSAGSGLGGWNGYTCGAFFACGLAAILNILLDLCERIELKI
jgi:hypothetical protein